MHIEFLLEEPSAAEVLNTLVPRIVGNQITFAIHPFNGKHDLLKKLPNRLKGYRHSLPADSCIVVLLDRDNDDCIDLKQRLEQIAHEAGLTTKTDAGEEGRFQVVNRIAVEELEAWFFGDVPALVATFPRIPSTLDQQAPYRDPDAIAGGTAEALQRLLLQHGYREHAQGLLKIEVARRIAEHMDPDRNRSKSFQLFRDTLRRIVR